MESYDVQCLKYMELQQYSMELQEIQDGIIGGIGLVWNYRMQYGTIGVVIGGSMKLGY